MDENKYTKREQFLLAILPAAMLLVLYSFLIALPKQRAYQNLIQQLDQTRESSVDEVAAEQSQSNLRLARESLNRLKTRLNKDRVAIRNQSQDWRNQDARLETVEELTQMMGRFDLSIISQDYQDEPSISSYLLNLFGQMDEASPAAPAIEFWKIEVKGGYKEVYSFLSEIDLNRMKTFPITINMAASETGDGVHTWTIIFVV